MSRAVCAFGVERASVIVCACEEDPHPDPLPKGEGGKSHTVFFFQNARIPGIIFAGGAHRRAQTKPLCPAPEKARFARADMSVSSWDYLPSPAGRGAGGEGQMTKMTRYPHPNPRPGVPAGKRLLEFTLFLKAPNSRESFWRQGRIGARKLNPFVLRNKGRALRAQICLSVGRIIPPLPPGSALPRRGPRGSLQRKPRDCSHGRRKFLPVSSADRPSRGPPALYIAFRVRS